MLADDIALSFYTWEQRGRGWKLSPDYVRLEPNYSPFAYRAPEPVVDDGRRPRLIERLGRGVAGLIHSAPAALPPPVIVNTAPPASPVEWQEFRFLLAPNNTNPVEAMDAFLISLSALRHPVSFEIIADANAIRVQSGTAKVDASLVEQQLAFHFPHSLIEKTANHLSDFWNRATGVPLTIDFGLSREFMLPLKIERFLIDPLTGLVAVLDGLAKDEVIIYQVLAQSVQHPWAQNIHRAAMLPDGSPVFSDKPEFLAQTRTKISRPLFAVATRVAIKAPNLSTAKQLGRAVVGALACVSNPVGNELIPLDNAALNEEQREAEVLYRSSRRSGMILNLGELVALAHPPSPAVVSTKLERANRKTKTAPAPVLDGGVILGVNVDKGIRREVRLQPDQRVRHTHVIGASGTGKSSLLLNLITQDIADGRGIGLLDPHGDLVDAVISRLPSNRLSEVILFDPSDSEFSIGFNVLQAHNELEKNLLASDLVAVFKRLATTWGDQMSSVLGNAILAFLESDRGGTLIDLRRFLLEAGFRNEFLTSVADPEIVYYWRHHFPMLKGAPVVSVLTRLDSFLRTKTIRYMVAQKRDRLDFGNIIDSGKIFLAKLSQGLIGEENSYLLGSLLVSRFHQAAMSRQALAHYERKPYFLYIDEFHHFATPSMVSILSGARKYALGLTLAHQELRQLEDGDGSLSSAVLSNPYTRVCFRVGDQDARRLENGFSLFKATELQSLSIRQAICRVERADFDFNLETLPVEDVNESAAADLRRLVLDTTRENFASPRAEIETALAKSRRAMADKSAPSVPAAPPAVLPSVPTVEAPVQPVEVEQTRQEQAPVPKRQVPTAGKGGREHKYIQQLIRQWGQGMGYLATVEKAVTQGLIDVALESSKRRVACEITITTPLEHEIANVRKCLEAGFDLVAVVAPDAKRLEKIEKSMRPRFSTSELKITTFVTPESLFRMLENLDAQDAGREETVRGYKVKVNYSTVDELAKNDRTAVISKVIADVRSKNPK